MLNNDDLNYLYRYACSLTNRDEEAYDYVHDAILELQKYSPDNPRAYTKTIIRNKFFLQLKKSKRYEAYDVDDGRELIEIDAINKLESLSIQSEQVKSILESLKTEEREILFMWAVEGHTFEEISAITGIKIGTLLSKVSRLRKKVIAEQLKKEVVDERK